MFLLQIGRVLKSIAETNLVRNYYSAAKILTRQEHHLNRILTNGYILSNNRNTISKDFLKQPIHTSSKNYADEEPIDEEAPPRIFKKPPPRDPLPPRPTDELVRKLMATEDMKRTIGRELRRCGGMIEHMNYGRMVYDSWNGFSEQVLLKHIGDKHRLMQLMEETMKEDVTFKAYVHNVLHDRLRSRPELDIPGGRNLAWYLAAFSILAAMFNYYITSIVLFIGALFLTFYY